MSERKPNAVVNIKFIDGKMVLYIDPETWNAGIILSRFHLLHEDGCKVDGAAFGPIGDGEECDWPVTLMFDLEPRTKRAKKFFEHIKDRKIPKAPKRRSTT